MPHNNVQSQPKKLSKPRRLLAAFAVVTLLSFSFVSLSAAPRADPQQKALKRRQKEERKQLKQEQTAMKRAMAQHGQTAASRKRFQRDMKMQRQLLRDRQKHETRTLKSSRKARNSRPVRSPTR
jgi:hypothetical protein